ncbi:MAG: peroxiredoxin [Nanoarchaeota archaeon]
MTKIIKEGNRFPDFCLPDQDNNDVCLHELEDKWKVIYFYPKDNTPGCTQEAKDFSSLQEEFENLNCIILGISPDSPSSHKKFIEKHNLKITLLSDKEKKLIKKVAWGKKKVFGKEKEGLVRTTYLLSPNNIVMKVWSPVKVKGHAQEVLDTLKKLVKKNK